MTNLCQNVECFGKQLYSLLLLALLASNSGGSEDLGHF